MGNISVEVHLTAIDWVAITVVKPEGKEQRGKELVNLNT
jgi:hypothetical protein